MIPKSIFLLLIPGTIYSIALIDLIRLFRANKFYWEPHLWGVFLYTVIIINWINLYDDIGKMTDQIFMYSMYMIGPLIFTQTVAVLVPKEGSGDLQKHFLKVRKLFFTLAASVVLYHFIFQFFIEDSNRGWLRMILVVIYALNIFIDRFYLRLIALITSLFFSFLVYYMELF